MPLPNLDTAKNYFNNTKTYFTTYASESKQSLCALAVKSNQLRSRTDFFYKIAQIAGAALALYLLCTQGDTNSKLLSAISAVTISQDFCNMIKYPYQILHPVRAEVINEMVLLNSLKGILQAGYDKKPNPRSEQFIDKFAIALLKNKLSEMRDNGDDFSTIGEFKEALYLRLNDEKFQGAWNKENITQNANNNNVENFQLTPRDKEIFKDINFAKLVVELHPSTLLEKITTVVWLFVDLHFFGICLHQFKLVDMAKFTARIGQFTSFHWIKNLDSDLTFIRLICLGFGTQFLEAFRKWCDEKNKLNAESKIKTLAASITSFAESILYNTVHLNMMSKIAVSAKSMFALTIFVKSLGAIAIAAEPQHQYFTAAPQAA